MGSLIAAYTVAWAVLMIYVSTLAARQRRLRDRLERLREQMPASGEQRTAIVAAPEAHAR